MTNNPNSITDKLDEPGLITPSIVPRDQTFYLATEDDLESIKNNKLLVNVFMALASVGLGAFFSAIISKISVKLSQNTLMVLNTYQWLTFGLGMFFLFLAIYFHIQISNRISSLKSADEIDLTASSVPEHIS